ncbi:MULTISPECIES: hypothetical protein [Gordonia]|jgi:hypothetical protein|uniref:Uncharacterized protein n=2 Tax=Gordonia terrae TaxID=2055 RepID=A0A2I1R5F9_9ACTN|nr:MULTISPECIES: hypothetical protein [Gordonia]VTR10900.1 Uncharacterised protein [Clostridioides difficile]ANY24420.1 hypothetical protein BCM27_17900 [Gordonia terrae]AWO85167.1 hypothetical protein DLJ61_18095 [Gordonia terrae]PKZ64374.1 hypothetical protein CYJ73_17410 [Gordonia terrae]VTS58900.1 Uncharacterised protein [Gordonia terrae]
MADSNIPGDTPGRDGPHEDRTARPIPGADDPTQIIPTQGIPPQDPPPQESPSGSDRRRRIDWGHIARTRIRTSTAILVAVFLACCVLYGYTSQRYGVVAPAPARPAPTSSQTVEPTYEPPPSTTSSTTSTTTESSTTDTTGGVDGTDGTSTDGTRSQTPSTSRETIPGLPNIPLPNFGGQTPTTTVPTR